jgi:hypothetical protein
MDHYVEMRQFFPQLPNELWHRITWFVLRFTMKEKLEQCLPIKSNFDVFENEYHYENEAWDGHCHKSLIDNAIVDEKILGYSHYFFTDCAMWYEGEDREEVISNRDHQMFYHERAHMIYYKTHSFTLEKRRIDDPTLSFKIIYVSQIYLDGSVQLIAVEHE